VTRLESRISQADQRRLLTGFVVQPFAAAALGFAIFPLVEWSGNALDGRPTFELLRPAIKFALAAGIAGFLVTVCAALPIVLSRLERGPLSLRQVLVIGAALGNAPLAIIVLLSIVTNQKISGISWLWLAGALRGLAMGTYFGVAGAALFWAISVRGRDVSRERSPG
jgi:hypothetical protein